MRLWGFWETDDNISVTNSFYFLYFLALSRFFFIPHSKQHNLFPEHQLFLIERQFNNRAGQRARKLIVKLGDNANTQKRMGEFINGVAEVTAGYGIGWVLDVVVWVDEVVFIKSKGTRMTQIN